MVDKFIFAGIETVRLSRLAIGRPESGESRASSVSVIEYVAVSGLNADVLTVVP